MRILFISQYFDPEPFSNTAIAEYLSSRGHSISVVCCVPNYPEGVFYDGYSNTLKTYEKHKNIDIHRVYTLPRGKSSISLFMNYIAYPASAIFKIRKKEAFGADISFVSLTSPVFQALPGAFAKWRHKVPTVFWIQDLWPQTLFHVLNIRNKWIRSLMTHFCSWLYKRADLLLVQNDAMIAPLLDLGIPRNKIDVLPNTSGEKKGSEKSPALVNLTLPEDRLIMMFAGNVGESQALEILVEAVSKAQFRDKLHVVIVGSGRAEKNLQSSIATFNLEGYFSLIGRVPSKSMPAIFAKADILYLSLQNAEIFERTVPYKLQNYMAAGKPILGSLTGETARLIATSESGMTAPPMDPNALAATIDEMCDLSAEGRARMGINGQAYFEANYSQDAVFEKLESALKSVEAGHR